MTHQIATQNKQQTSTTLPLSKGGILQRKCESCGQHTIAGGECADCAKNKRGLQRQLTGGASNDNDTDPVVVHRTASALTSSASLGQLQRQAAPKEKTNQEKYQEGLEKLGEAFLKTPLGQELLEKIKQDALVKGATQLGKDFISTWTGKIVTGVAATGAVTALAATHKELPAQIPEIPLDVITPGLSVRLTYKGPVDRPTEATIVFKFTEQAPKDPSGKKPLSAADKFRAETARLTAENEKFKASMHYKPGSPEDLQQKAEQKAEQEAVRRVALKYSGGLDITAIPLATPQPKSDLQLTMPKPSFGIQPPSLFGDEFKLKPPTEEKQKEDEPKLQKQLSIGASNDPLELEADRIADRVLAAPTNTTINPAPSNIQRFTGQTDDRSDLAPASVDRVLSSPGRPLETSLQQDMGQRFGHDFSHVRVHTDAEAERSAQDVNANAYTVGHNIVFGAGLFTPGTNNGRRLLAHELTHVVQQKGAANLVIQKQDNDASPATPSPSQSTGWTSDLLTIVLSSDDPDCLGMANSSGSSLYSNCGSVQPPFCQSARVPFNVRFFIDRIDNPRPQPFRSPTVSVNFEFKTTAGTRTSKIDKTDPHPRYVAPNVPLEPSFGHSFPIGSSESGELSVQLELHDASGVNVTYNDRIQYIIKPCV